MKVIILSDLHFTKSTQWKTITDDMLNRIKNVSRDRETVLFAFLGDLIDGSREHEIAEERFGLVDEFLDYIKKNIVTSCFCFVPGNHDLFGGAEDDAQLDLFNSFINKYSIMEGCIFSKDHSVYSFIKEDVNFILVDSNLSRNYKCDGKIDLDEICHHIEHNKKNIIFMHHPPCKQEETSGENDKSIPNSNELINTNSQFIFYGHQHGFHKVLDYFRENTDIHAIGAFLKTEAGVKRDFILLNISNGSIKSAYRYNYNSIKFQKSILFPKRENIRSEAIEFKEPEKNEIYIERSYKIEYNNDIFSRDIDYIIRNFDRIVIVSPAGLGKSFELSHIFYKYKDNEDFFLIYIQVKSTSISDIKKLVQYGINNSVDHKNLFYLIDGINEASSKKYTEICEAISSLSLLNATVKIIVSTRNSSDITLSDFHKVILNSFYNEQIKEYALKSGIDNAEEFIAELSEKTYGISDNPFYLKMSALVYKTEHQLPPIHDFIKQALHKRFIDSSRKISVECCNNIMDSEYTLNLSFKKLAFVMQVMGMPCIINENYTCLIDQDLRKLHQYSGIINLQEDTYDRYFEHDLLREYYVSELIYNMSLETLINIISFEIQGKRVVKRFWYEVVYKTLYKRESRDLIDWLIENDFEFYIKAETEKLPVISDINIAIKLIEYCISHKINIRSIKYDFEAIIEKYDNDDTWDFVFNKIKEKNENISLLTLLHVIKCVPQDRLDIAILDILFAILKECISDENVVILILKIFLKSKFIDTYIDKIVDETKDIKDTIINKVLFDIIAQSSLPDRYFEIIINKLKCKEYNQISISFDKSFEEYIYSLKTIDKMLMAVSYINDDSYYFKAFHADKLFEELINKISEYYKEHEEAQKMIFDKMFDYYLISCKNYYMDKSHYLLHFFINTDEKSNLLKRIITDVFEFNICFCLASIIDKTLIDDLIGYFKNEYINDSTLISLIKSNSIDTICKNKMRKAYEEKTGETFKVNNASTRSEITVEDCYFDLCFDVKKIKSVILELKNILGDNTKTTELLTQENYSRFKEFPLIRQIAGAIYRFEINGIPLSEFVSSVNYHDLQMFMIFEQFTSGNIPQLQDTELAFLKEYYEDVINTVNFEEINPDGKVDYGICEIVVVLIDKLGFLCPDEKLLEMLMLPWYVFTHTSYADESPTLDFVSSHISDKLVVKERIIFNLENKQLNEDAQDTHLKYCSINKLPNAIKLAEHLVIKGCENQHLRIYAAEYLIEMTNEKYVDEMISPEMDDKFIKSLSQYMKHRNDNLVNEMLRRNAESPDKLIFVKELLDLENINGIRLYYNYVKYNKKIPEDADPNYSSSDLTMKIGEINNIEFKDYIKQLVYIAYSDRFSEDNSRWGLKGNINYCVNNMIRTFPKEMLPIIDEIEEGNKENQNLVSFCEYYRYMAFDTMENTEQQNWSFENALDFIKTIKI